MTMAAGEHNTVAEDSGGEHYADKRAKGTKALILARVSQGHTIREMPVCLENREESSDELAAR
jgi:hypothetical protein